MGFDVIIQTKEKKEPIYSRRVAIQLARISPDFLRRCEQANLVQIRFVRGGKRGYTQNDVNQLARIRRLQEDLELELTAVEVVLRLRRRIIDLLQEMEIMEQQHLQREMALRREISTLRQLLSQESDWK